MAAMHSAKHLREEVEMEFRTSLSLSWIRLLLEFQKCSLVLLRHGLEIGGSYYYVQATDTAIRLWEKFQALRIFNAIVDFIDFNFNIFQRGETMASIAIIVGEGFEDSEFQVPYDRLTKAEHDIEIMGVQPGSEVTGKRGQATARIDVAAHASYLDHYDALVIPGGQGPDHLRTHQDIVAFVQGFINSGKPVAAICHGPQLLIEADAVSGRTLTSWPSIKTDLVNAGASWLDQELVIDGNLITSRKPDDLNVFCDAIEQALQHPPPHPSHA